MVGVPSSKGCSLCLKRSIKVCSICDEARPSCSQCRRGGRTCPGYTRNIKFIDEGPRLRVSGRAASSSSLSSSSRSVSVSSSSSLASTLWHWSGQGSPELSVSSSKMELDQVFSCFVAAMFPLGSVSVQRSFLGSWLWHIPPRLGRNAALDFAAQSLALTYFSRVSGDDLLRCRADMSYTRALNSLTSCIADPQKQFSSEVMCATLLMACYESFVDVENAWIHHAGGAARLMELRGARRSYESPFDYSMFLTCRSSIVSQSILAEKPCFLDGEDWRSVPDGLIYFPLLPDSPDLYHVIYGLFAAIPRVIDRAKRMTDHTPQTVRQSWLSTAQTLRDDIRLWYSRFTSENNGLKGPVLAQRPLSALCNDLFHSAYRYFDVLSASVIITYFAYLIKLNKAIDLIVCSEDHTNENRELAQEICMSVEYCLSAGYCGTQTMRIALPIAQSALPPSYQDWTTPWIKKFSSSMQASLIQPVLL